MMCYFSQTSLRTFPDVCNIFLQFMSSSVFSLTLTQERTATLKALAEKAKLTEEVLNTVEGIRCNPVQGAMYSFPRVTIPEKAVKEATVSTLNNLIIMIIIILK